MGKVALIALAGDRVNLFFKQPLASFPGYNWDAENRVAVNARLPLDAANADGFHKHLEDERCFLSGSIHAKEMAVVRFSESLSALSATEALITLTIFPEFLPLALAIVAGHFGSCLSSGFEP